MNRREVTKIGGQQGFKLVLISLLTIYLWVALYESTYVSFKEAILWVFNFESNLVLLTGVWTSILSGVFYGRVAARQIIKKHNSVLLGVLFGICVLLTMAIFISIAYFLQEGYQYLGTRDDLAINKLVKPFFAVSFYGLFLFTGLGIWFTYRVRKQIESY